MVRLLAILVLLPAHSALVMPSSLISGAARSASLGIRMSGVWNSGLDFGKGQFRFYEGFDKWMEPFPKEDREAYPSMFRLPTGVYETKLTAPLGIAFEERNEGGVVVDYLVEGGSAELQGTIQPGDVLVGVSAVKVIGAKWERRLVPCHKWPLETVVGAIGSNQKKWGCQDVILQFTRKSDAADDEAVAAHLEFFEPPLDSPWKK
jgi:hypothetical protein